MTKLSYIIPCYFNGENLPITTKVLIENEKKFSESLTFEYVMIDDGSKDNTWDELQKFHALYPNKVRLVKLASNVGSFNAILAGMTYATGDCNVILAADLQDPPELIPQMLGYWQQGIKLVIANRADREESVGQKLFSNTYHYLIKKLALKNVPEGGFDLVLFDKELRNKVVEINEKNTNILYLLTWLGYDYVNIPYIRRKREIGKSRWTLTKKVKMFIDSFVAFSFFPIRTISVIGVLLSLCAILYACVIIFAKMTNLIQVEGWSSMMLVILIVSSFQMLGMGILGEYIWRTLDTVRKRPPFVVEIVKDEKSN
jgi:glycosyltransferase involved in cell wall biosynthesis